jgi:hypothetical protein
MTLSSKILLILVFTWGSAKSQEKKITTSRFVLDKNGLGSSEIWLNSDSTFFYTASDCLSCDLTIGRWYKNKKQLILNSYDSSMNIFKAKLSFLKARDEKEYAIFCIDYFGKPLTEFPITVQGDTIRPIELFTDSTGKIIIDRTRYSWFSIGVIESKFVEDKFIYYKLDSIGEMGLYKLQVNLPYEILKSRSSINIKRTNISGMKIESADIIYDNKNKLKYKIKAIN